MQLHNIDSGSHVFSSQFHFMPRLDNDKLKLQLKKKDDDLLNAKSTIERFTNAVSIRRTSTNKNLLTDI